MRNVRMEQNALKTNLSKFNTFVREKELKSMKGVRCRENFQLSYTNNSGGCMA